MKERCFPNRKGYFFLIDSLLALGVLVVGGFLILSSYSQAPREEGAAVLAENLMDFFSNTRIKGTNNQYVGVGGELWQQGIITNSENTLLQQIGTLYATNKSDIAEKFIANLTQNAVPKQYLFEFWIDGTLLYPGNPPAAHLDSKNSTKVLIPSRKMVYGFISEETGDLFGPYEAEVLVWQGT